MKKYILDQAFELLREIGLVRSRSDFCLDWLGQSECYLRTLQFKNAEPSMGVMAICASRLQSAADLMMTNERYHKLADRFLYVSGKCHELVNEDAVELELTD